MMLRLRLALLTLLAALAPAALHAQLTLVDVIPQMQSDETYQNAETNITVDPAHPNTVVVTSFTGMRPTATNAPVFVSFDGGQNWNANEIVPSTLNNWISTFDISVRFAGSSGFLYAGLLQATGSPGIHFRMARTNDANLNTVMPTFFPRDSPDQPFAAAATVMGWFDPGKDRVYIGSDDFGVPTTRSTVDYTLDASIAAPVNNTVRVETTTPGSGRDGHQCRPAIHPDGTVYVAFVRWNDGVPNADVVVVRDDNWGQGSPAFQSLMNGMNVGVSVVSNVPIPNPDLGLQRTGGNLAIAVDPRDSQSVYVSYEDHQGGDTTTLHLRHSADGGATWPGGDLLTVHNAHNTAIAVNSHGRIGMLYQQLVACGMAQCWETHLRRSDDGMSWNDLMLARFTDGTPARDYWPYLGDYDDLRAVGKDFVGVFSSANIPDTANFAPGVQFNRNANWMTHQLLGNDGTTVVNTSIDPFYFRTNEVAATDDYYVRDWTDGAGVHDEGAEPSTHDAFYTTADVWNRRTNDPSPFNGADQPVNQRAQPMAMGTNFAFARISRNAHTNVGSVSAHFLYSDGGVGVNFEDAGTTVIPFTAADSAITPAAGAGVTWNLPSGASNHVCLAVEIDGGASDPMIAPSLLHRAPGWPETDLSIVLDNNKAQRNMEVYDGNGGNTPSPAYAVIHNASLEVRDMIVGVAVPRGMTPKIGIVGGQARELKATAAGRTFVLPRMLPGENRWISVELPFPSKEGALSEPVLIYEIAANQRVNGYGIAARRVSDAAAIRDNLDQQLAVLDRFGAFGDDQCRKAARTTMDKQDYASAVQPLAACAMRFVEKAGSDPFGVREAAAALSSATTDRERSSAHLSLLNRLDAFQTMQQKAQGDPADIAQMVALQRALYRRASLRRLDVAKAIVEESTRFLELANTREPLARPYESLLRGQLEAFARTFEFLGKPAAMARAFDALRSAPSDPRALERAHRDFLLALQDAARE
ncbi:MAG TPA: hypothetical protein VF824_06820 [Thermoanaerobaculia bacterium]